MIRIVVILRYRVEKIQQKNYPLLPFCVSSFFSRMVMMLATERILVYSHLHPLQTVALMMKTSPASASFQQLSCQELIRALLLRYDNPLSSSPQIETAYPTEKGTVLAYLLDRIFRYALPSNGNTIDSNYLIGARRVKDHSRRLQLVRSRLVV